MEEEEENPTTPFWLKTSTNPYGHRHRRSSSLSNPLLLIMLLAITALLLLFFVILSINSFVSQGSTPSSVKKKWESVNLLLVLFAVACGFLNRNYEDSSSSSSLSSSSSREANGVASHVSENPLQSTAPTRQWFEYSSDPRIYESVGSSNAYDSTNLISISTNTVRLRRNCSSYPDFKQEFSWASGDEDRWRFFDDNVIDFNAYRGASENFRRRLGPDHSAPPPPPPPPAPPGTETSNPASPLPPSPSLTPPQPPATRHRRNRTFHTVESKEKTESSNEVAPEINENRPLPPPSPPPPPPHPPPPAVKHRRSRTFHTGKKEGSNEVAPEMNKSRPLPPPSPPPPPPPPPPRLAAHHRSEQKSERNDRRGSGAKEIANTLASLYPYRKKKKKQKYKDDENSCNGTTQISPHSHSGDSSIGHPPPSPPPPPPPPPPASVFYNLFSYKKPSKSKRIHSSSLSQLNPSPPPPPPPPPKLTSSSIKRKSKREAPSAPPEEPSSDLPEQRKRSSATSGRRPPLWTKPINMLYEGEENLSSGGQSPLIPMPPPPPPPPFRMPEMKFVVRGGFVRVRSNLSSLSSSPVDSPTKAEDPESLPSTSATTATTMKAAAAAAVMDGGDAIGAVFCPSPDVDTKADTFIARFRDGLRLERINSIKDKKAAHGPQSRPKSFLKT